jgi:hypothetical protein
MTGMCLGGPRPPGSDNLNPKSADPLGPKQKGMAVIREPEFLPDWYRRRLARSRRRRIALVRFLIAAAVGGAAATIWPDPSPADAAATPEALDASRASSPLSPTGVE